MKNFPLFFNSSLPRSGSTLLQNLLAQNRRHHCTSTNDVLDMVIRVRDGWMGSTGFIAQGLATIEPRMKSFIRHALYGFYEPEFKAGQIVFDKSRGWLQNLELLEDILQRPVKAIVCVRDIRDVVASFEKIFRRSVFTEHPLPGEERIKTLTVQSRAERLLQPDKTIGYMAASLQDVFDRGMQDRLVIVPYWELTHYPMETVQRVCNECGLESFVCDPAKVTQVTKEDDTVYGMSLHTIRSQVEPDKGHGWVGVLPDELAARLDQYYLGIQQLAKQRFLHAGR